METPRPLTWSGRFRRLRSGNRAEGIMLREDLVDAGLVESSNNGRVLLRVTHALCECERRGRQKQGADGEEGSDPRIDGQIADRKNHGQQGDPEGDRGL